MPFLFTTRLFGCTGNDSYNQTFPICTSKTRNWKLYMWICFGKTFTTLFLLEFMNILQYKWVVKAVFSKHYRPDGRHPIRPSSSAWAVPHICGGNGGSWCWKPSRANYKCCCFCDIQSLRASDGFAPPPPSVILPTGVAKIAMALQLWTSISGREQIFSSICSKTAAHCCGRRILPVGRGGILDSWCSAAAITLMGHCCSGG